MACNTIWFILVSLSLLCKHAPSSHRKSLVLTCKQVQAWDGVAGGIIINGPATANYDEDLGNLFLSDWSHETSDVLALEAAVSGPPTFPNCLINGTVSAIYQKCA